MKWAIPVVLATGCLKQVSYQCIAQTDCVHDGKQGQCELDGYCSFDDTSCMSGRRYGELSGASANQCVALVIQDAGIDARPDAPPGICPATYAEIAGVTLHKYRKIASAASWIAQAAACAANAANTFLAIPDDQAELQALVDAMAVTKFWVGVSDSATEGTYVTVKGTAQAFLPWDNSEPDGNNDDCVLGVAASVKLADERCNLALAAMCECEP